MRKNKMIAMMMAVTLVCTTFTGCGKNDPVTATEIVDESTSGSDPENATLEASATATPEITALPRVTITPKVTATPKATITPQAIASPETATSEATANSETATASEATASPEAATASEATATSEVTATAEASAVPETPATSVEQPATAASTLPGINRNNRYPDIPESILPGSVAANAYFVDEPIYGKPWPDVTGKIYADYMRTQLIKVAEYGVDDFMLIAYCDEDEANGMYGNSIVIYNGQYAIINEVLFAIWVNGIDPEFN